MISAVNHGWKTDKNAIHGELAAVDEQTHCSGELSESMQLASQFQFCG